MNRLLIRLWGVLEGEDPESINYQIANKLVTSISSIRHTSSADLARLCNVSKPSISRFGKALGYDDFYDFRAELNQYCPDQGAKYVLSDNPSVDGGPLEYLNRVKDNLTLLQLPEFQEQAMELARDIMTYPQVYLMGHMQSGKTAASLHYNLHVIKKNISAVTSLKEQTDILQNGRPGALMVIFSVSGEYFRAIFSGGELPARARGAKLWLVTTNPAVKRMDGVDAILNSRTGSDLAGSNICLELTANMIAQNCWSEHQ